MNSLITTKPSCYLLLLESLMESIAVDFLVYPKENMMALGLEFLVQHLKNQFCKT